MNEMIERVSKAIELAKGNAPFYVAISRFKNKYKYDVIQMMPVNTPDVLIKEYLSQDEAEDKCEQLNNEYVARKVIEALKGEIPSDVYDNFKCDELWKDLNSIKVWNLWLDAILKEV